jgi:hypothetical protein
MEEGEDSNGLPQFGAMKSINVCSQNAWLLPWNGTALAWGRFGSFSSFWWQRRLLISEDERSGKMEEG